MFEFKMPSLGADMTEGTLTNWNVDVGDHIKRGEVLCEVETSKGAIDVEIWESGVVTALKIQPGDNVPVGETIATLVLDGAGAQQKPGTPDEPESTPAPTPAPETRPEMEVAEVKSDAAEMAATAKLAPDAEAEVETPVEAEPARPEAAEPYVSGKSRILISPAARRLAEQRGIDPSGIKGTGIDGSITLADVEGAPDTADTHRRVSPLAKKMAIEHGINLNAVEGHGPHGAVESADVEAFFKEAKSIKDEFAPERKAPSTDFQTSMRAAIAVAMAKSKREIPHYYLSEEISMHRALTWLEERNAKAPVSERILPAVLLIKAVALSTREVPEMNGVFENDAFTQREDVNPGFAIALKGGGVIPPALFNADQKSLSEIMDDLKDLVARVRRGKLRSSEVMDATITITSLGDLGVNAVYGVIYPPQVAIVGFGRITERIFVEDGMIGVKRGLTATLSGDHRVSDGIAGARFLAKIRDILQTPETL